MSFSVNSITFKQKESSWMTQCEFFQLNQILIHEKMLYFFKYDLLFDMNMISLDKKKKKKSIIVLIYS